MCAFVAALFDETFSHQRTIMDLNNRFNDDLKTNMLYCRWNSIHILSIVSYSEISDTTMRGRIVHVSVGRDSVGSFSIRGALYLADGDIAISSSEDIVKCCAGSKPWMLVRFALSRQEEEPHGFDKQYLEMF